MTTPLTPQLRDVLRLVAVDLAVLEIAGALDVSRATVRRRLLSLRTDSLVEIVRYGQSSRYVLTELGRLVLECAGDRQPDMFEPPCARTSRYDAVLAQVFAAAPNAVSAVDIAPLVGFSAVRAIRHLHQMAAHGLARYAGTRPKIGGGKPQILFRLGPAAIWRLVAMPGVDWSGWSQRSRMSRASAREAA